MESWLMDLNIFEDSSMDQLTEEVISCTCNDSFEDGIDRLPDEVLIMIIASLPLEDRKNTRLVSTRWHNLNNIAQISRREKFICRGVYGLVSVLQIVRNSTKAVLNLEFIHSDFAMYTDLSFEFWTENGERIESLSFTHCQFSEETVQHIVIHCDKMKNLAIHKPIVESLPDRITRKIVSGPALEKLINLRRADLRSFKLEADTNECISNNFLRVMFHIYPNIDDFSFIHPDGFCDVDLTDEDLLRSDEKLTYHNIHKKLVESKEMMKSMNFDTVEMERHGDVLSHDFPKLHSLGRMYLQPVLKHPIFDFLSRHRQLRAIDFHLEVSVHVLEDLMNSLLDSCTSLESLKIEVSNYVFLSDARIFAKIRTSKLKSLNLNFLLESRSFDEIDKTPINKTLKCLHLTHSVNGSRSNRGMVRAFVRKFRGLSDLTIDRLGVNDDDLQNIFLCQRQLVSLKLRLIGSVSDYGFTGRNSHGEGTGFSIKDLRKLQCLEISRPEEGASKRFFEDLMQLPNLKSFFLDVRIPREFLENEFITGLKDVEILVLKGAQYNHTLPWLRMCRLLKKLKFLSFETFFPLFHESKLSKQVYEPLFEDCPKLRVFRYREVFSPFGHRQKSTTCTYFLDDVTEAVNEIARPEEPFLPPDIDPYWAAAF